MAVYVDNARIPYGRMLDAIIIRVFYNPALR